METAYVPLQFFKMLVENSRYLEVSIIWDGIDSWAIRADAADACYGLETARGKERVFKTADSALSVARYLGLGQVEVIL